MTYAIGQRDGEDVLLLTMEGHVLAFDSRVQAEDFSDDLDEPGEWIVVNLNEVDDLFPLVYVT